MRFAYVTVIQAPNEEEARSYAERCLQPEQGDCLMIGGGAVVTTPKTEVRTGPIAALVAKDAYEGEEDICERLSRELWSVV